MNNKIFIVVVLFVVKMRVITNEYRCSSVAFVTNLLEELFYLLRTQLGNVRRTVESKPHNIRPIFGLRYSFHQENVLLHNVHLIKKCGLFSH